MGPEIHMKLDKVINDRNKCKFITCILLICAIIIFTEMFITKAEMYKKVSDILTSDLIES